MVLSVHLIKSKSAGARWLAAMVALWLGFFSAAAEPFREYQVKAVFLYNFAQFTEWPTNAFANTNSPIVIGILGTDPFGSALDEAVRNETIRGRRLVVEHYRRAEEIQTCHILFISQSEARRLDQDMSSLRGRPILTVSDIDSAALRGVMIRLITENNKIRLRINLDAVNTSRLVISSKLLRAAETIYQSSSP